MAPGPCPAIRPSCQHCLRVSCQTRAQGTPTTLTNRFIGPSSRLRAGDGELWRLGSADAEFPQLLGGLGPGFYLFLSSLQLLQVPSIHPWALVAFRINVRQASKAWDHKSQKAVSFRATGWHRVRPSRSQAGQSRFRVNQTRWGRRATCKLLPSRVCSRRTRWRHGSQQLAQRQCDGRLFSKPHGRQHPSTRARSVSQAARHGSAACERRRQGAGVAKSGAPALAGVIQTSA